MEVKDERKGLGRLAAAEEYAWGELDEAFGAVDRALRGASEANEIVVLLAVAEEARVRWAEVARAKLTFAAEAMRRINIKAMTARPEPRAPGT